MINNIKIEKSNILSKRRQNRLVVFVELCRTKSTQRVLCDEIYVLIRKAANRGFHRKTVIKIFSSLQLYYKETTTQVLSCVYYKNLRKLK